LNVIGICSVRREHNVVEVLNECALVLVLVVYEIDALAIVCPAVRTEINTDVVGLVRRVKEIESVTLEEGEFSPSFS
jgi:hypothetical protein